MAHSTQRNSTGAPATPSPLDDTSIPAERAQTPRGAATRESRTLAWALGLLAAGVVIIPLDDQIARIADAVRLGGDVRRELGVIQQFGGAASLLIAFALVASLDADRLRRFLDLGVAAGVVALAALAGKMLIGRPRPTLDDPFTVLGPFTPYPLANEATPPTIELTYAWQFTAENVEQLWSMPSSHTTAAVTLAAFLAVVYPRLRAFAIGMATIVGLCRVLFGAHYPSDVLVGAGLAIAIATPIVRNGLGVRLIDTLWLRLIDRNATPAWPAIKGMTSESGLHHADTESSAVESASATRVNDHS
jgi:membrane-associated phospholipid phosphatase